MAIETIAEAAMIVRPDFSKASHSVQSGAKTLVRTISAITASVTGVGLAGMIGFGIKSAAALEQAQIGFETLLGSAQKASTFLKDLQRFAASTPFELPGLIDASRTLLGVGVASKQVIPILTAFGDTAGAVGIGQEAFQRIMIATSQSISAGRFSLQDLNQIMTNGIPIYTILSKALGKPVPEIRKMATAGKLLAKDVLPLLQKEMEKDYGGAMARQSQTLAGVWSTLKDTVAIGLATAIKPLVPLLTELIPKAAEASSRAIETLGGYVEAFANGFKGVESEGEGLKALLAEVGGQVAIVGKVFSGAALSTEQAETPIAKMAATLNETLIPYLLETAHILVAEVVPALARLVADGMAVVLPITTAVAEAIDATLIPALVGLLGWVDRNRKLVEGFGLAIAGILGYLKLMEIGLAAVALVTRAAATATALWAAIQGTIAFVQLASQVRSFAEAWVLLDAAMDANPIGIVVLALAALVAGLIYAWHHSETFRNIVMGAWHGIQAAVSAVVNWFMTTVWPTMKRVLDNIASAAVWLWRNVIQPAWKGISWEIKTASAIIQLAIAVVVSYFRNVVAPFYLWLWHKLFEPVFKGISYVVKGNLQSVIANVQLVWKIVGPIFKAIGHVVSIVLVNQFKAGVSGIKKAWDLVKKYAMDPVKFVVNWVINPLIGGFNKIAKIFGTSQIAPITGFAEGGRIPGPPSSRDNRLAWLKNKSGQTISNIKVATGEFIVNAKDTAKALPLLQWINGGMRGGPAGVAARLGRGLSDMPGDGSEGWAFAGGGLVGFLSNVWDAVSNPSNLIKKPLEAMVARIPGGGLIKSVLAGMGHKLIDGLIKWIGGAGGTATGSIGKAQAFVKAQAGKPYVWASAGPGGYDCSGIVSAVYNVMKGKNPYSHTFSTGSLPGSWFDTSKKLGPLVAGWSHPGQRPAGASVGHMAGMIGGLPFESTGSVGVRVGARARRTVEFANQGVARASGGLVELIRMGRVAKADFGAVTLAPGANMVYNHTGRPEPMEATRPGTGPGSGGRMHPDDIAALAEAIGDGLARALMGTVPASRNAARAIGKRPRS